MEELHYRYNRCPIIVDSTGAGDVVLEAIQNEPYKLDASGYCFGGGKEKENLVVELQAAIQDCKIRFPFIKEIVDQLIYYSWNDKQLQTDAVFGLALAWQCALEHGMDESRITDALSTPDLGPISVSRGLDGRPSFNGLIECQVCEHPALPFADEFLKSHYLIIDGQPATDYERLAHLLGVKFPDAPLSKEQLKAHERHVNQAEGDEDFEHDWNRKWGKMLLL